MLLGIWQKWPGFLVYFLAGAVAYRFGDCIRYTNRLAAAAALCLGMTLILRQGFTVVWPLGALISHVLWLAVPPQNSASRHRQAALGGDYSYGIYLYAWPIQQLLVLYSHNRLPPIAHFALATVVTVIAGVASWHLPD